MLSVHCWYFVVDYNITAVPSLAMLHRAAQHVAHTATFISQNRAGSLATLGGFLILLTFSLDFSYSNLNTYVVSYMRRNG